MTDIEKLVAKTIDVIRVEETTKKTTYYNCFGDIIDENIVVTKGVYTFDKTKGKWVRGVKNETT